MLINPIAGRGRGARVGRRVAERLRRPGLDVSLRTGDSPEGMIELAAHAVSERPDAIVVVGGDGTLSSILGEVLGSGIPIAFAPAGTGNDLARSLGIPCGSIAEAAAAAELAVSGRTMMIDVGEVECAGRRSRFLTVAALGFDARVADRTNRLRWPGGRLRYYVALVVELLRLRPMRFSLTIDAGGESGGESSGEPVVSPGTLIAVGNTRSYGGGMPICPEADPCDGMLDVTRVAPIGRLRLIRLFPFLLRGRHLALPEVGHTRCRRIEVSAPDLVVYADGERVAEGRARIRVIPGVLSVLVP